MASQQCEYTGCLRYFASTLKKNCRALRLDAGQASPKTRPAISFFDSGRPVCPGLYRHESTPKTWINAFTGRTPDNYLAFP